MTYKIDTKTTEEGYRLEIQGRVDAAALDQIRAAVRAQRTGTLWLVLKEGCQVEVGILQELKRLGGVAVVAESPFLARWLELI